MENIKDSVLSQEELNLLREKYVIEYAKQKGWNPNELTTNQMLEIVNTKEYKSPGLILS